MISRILSDGEYAHRTCSQLVGILPAGDTCLFQFQDLPDIYDQATHRIIYEFEINLFGTGKRLFYADLERIGKNKILSAVEDTRVIGEAPEIFINTFNAIIIILSCLGYIYTVSYAGW